MILIMINGFGMIWVCLNMGPYPQFRPNYMIGMLRCSASHWTGVPTLFSILPRVAKFIQIWYVSTSFEDVALGDCIGVMLPCCQIGRSNRQVATRAYGQWESWHSPLVSCCRKRWVQSRRFLKGFLLSYQHPASGIRNSRNQLGSVSPQG